ncbi:oxidoreductase [Raoultella planticola]|uniref:Oxidoreductase n=1 Tax=Raoultella planticola TaxID=575 RepID=A0A485DBD2_RAOPL|nr:oxidoreductase [Raoultella planticola]
MRCVWSCAYSGIKVSLIEPGPINTRFTTNVNQTQRDKPVENPGIAARFTLGPEAVVEKSAPCFYQRQTAITLSGDACHPRRGAAQTPAADATDGQNYPGLS